MSELSDDIRRLLQENAPRVQQEDEFSLREARIFWNGIGRDAALVKLAEMVEKGEIEPFDNVKLNNGATGRVWRKVVKSVNTAPKSSRMSNKAGQARPKERKA